MKQVRNHTSGRLPLFNEYLSQVSDAVLREGNYRISQSIFICRVDDRAFYYTGNNWQSEYRVSFSDFENIVLNGCYKKEQIRMSHLPAMAKMHAGYYSSIVYDFLNFSEIARAFSRPVRRFAA